MTLVIGLSVPAITWVGSKMVEFDKTLVKMESQISELKSDAEKSSQTTKKLFELNKKLSDEIAQLRADKK